MKDTIEVSYFSRTFGPINTKAHVCIQAGPRIPKSKQVDACCVSDKELASHPQSVS